MFPVDIAKLLRILFLYNTSGGCFWQSYHSAVKSAGVLVLWFYTSTHFRLWSKTFTKHSSNDFYCHTTTQFLLCLIWFVTCFQFQNMFWKNINCFWFWWKTYAKRCTSNYVIACVEGLSSLALCGWSGACSLRVWFGKWNIAPILISLCFCLLCWLKKHLFCILSLL